MAQGALSSDGAGARARGPRIRAPIADRDRRPEVADLVDILESALQAADPAPAIARALRVEGDRLVLGPDAPGERPLDVGPSGSGRLLVVAAGKAAVPMIAAARTELGARFDTGIAITTAGGKATAERLGLDRTTVFEAGHPLPDPAGLVASRQLASRLEALGRDDALLVLLSGGASALLALPAGRIPLIDLTAATSRLLGCGASIDEINTLRSHLGRLAGGGMARLAYPARLTTLILSDVVSGRLEHVGSGPTLPDPTTYADAGNVLSKYDLWGAMPASIGVHIRGGLAGQAAETAKPGDPIFERSSVRLLGGVAEAVAGARRRAESLGYVVAGGERTAPFEGEARDVGRVVAAEARGLAGEARGLAGEARGLAVGRPPSGAPVCLIRGGESTVTFRRLPGRGGRNRELALAAALALDGHPGVALATLATDGQDHGPEAAGAVVDPTTLARAASAGLDAAEALERHDSGPFFEALGDEVVTGPTDTNVGDLVVAVIGRPERTGAA